MANSKFNKQIFKKWWFWVVVVVVLGAIGAAAGGGDKSSNTTSNNNSNSSQTTTGTLPTVNAADYTGQEGLVAFKTLTDKGYTVTAKYVNEAVPATNADFTEQFTKASEASCNDRLGFDAYTVSSLTQTGDSVALVLGNAPTDNQTCPAGTTDDRS